MSRYSYVVSIPPLFTILTLSSPNAEVSIFVSKAFFIKGGLFTSWCQSIKTLYANTYCYVLTTEANGAPKHEGIINAGEVWTLVRSLVCVIYVPWRMKPNTLQV